MDAGETLCEETWQLYCKECSESTEEVTQDWLTNCAMHFCQVDNCDTGMTLDDAISQACLDTSLQECYFSQHSKIDDKFEHVLDL